MNASRNTSEDSALRRSARSTKGQKRPDPSFVNSPPTQTPQTQAPVHRIIPTKVKNTEQQAMPKAGDNTNVNVSQTAISSIDRKLDLLIHEMAGIKYEVAEIKHALSMKADQTDVDAIEVRVAALENKVTEQTAGVEQAAGAAEKDKASSTNMIPQIVREEIEERRQIEQRRSNLMIMNLEDKHTDQEDCQALFKYVGTDEEDVEIETTIRIGRRDTGRIQPLKVVMKHTHHKKKILSKATVLRDQQTPAQFEQVYIRPDLTIKQQREQKNLRDEIKELRSLHPDKRYKIQRGCIIEVQQQDAGPAQT